MPHDNELPPAEAYAFLGQLFPDGLHDALLEKQLCPDGWESSPLHQAFHPSAEQLYREHCRIRENFERFKKMTSEKRGEPFSPEPPASFEDFCKDRTTEDSPPESDPQSEIAELLGNCLWDVFSDNHDVIASDDRVVSLGSFRGSGGTIADFFGGTSWEPETDLWDRGHDYLRFYMGSIGIRRRTPLTPVYELIFQRLKKLGADWRYSFPRIHLVSFRKDEAVEDNVTNYSPSDSFAKKEEAEKKRG